MMNLSTYEWSPYVVHGVRHPGVWIAELEESKGMSLTARMDEGGFTNMHTHSGTETITILEGEAEVILDHVSHLMKKGDRMTIDPGVSHSLRNKTLGDLLVHAEFSPSFFEQETTLKN